MQNKTKGLIAGVAGIALLAGGSTFALWSDSVDVVGGSIVNGDLEITATTPLAWIDASTPRSDANHPIDPLTWKMVPGDVARGTQELTVTLVGDNLVADLGLTSTGSDLADDVTATYTLLDGTTTLATGTYGGQPTTVRFAANDADQGSTADTTSADVDVVVNATGTKTLTVRIDVAFAASSVRSQNDASVLGTLAVSLDQVRAGADFVAAA